MLNGPNEIETANDEGESCMVCVFAKWSVDEKGALVGGVCRRYPPTIHLIATPAPTRLAMPANGAQPQSLNVQMIPAFIQTMPENWCGEFEPIEEIEQPSASELHPL